MSGFTDLHSHFVYGMDDGAQTLEEMQAMLDAAYQDGITALYATPHAAPGMHPFDISLFEHHLSEARNYCKSRGYSIVLKSGAEVLYTPQLNWYIENHQLPMLEGTRCVLIEFAPRIAYADIQNAIETLNANGYSAIIAHAERYRCLRKPGTLRKLKTAYDVRFQVNANTVIRRGSFFERLRINRWFAKEMVDFVASDAHNTHSRPFRMKVAEQVLCERYGKTYAERLTKGII